MKTFFVSKVCFLTWAPCMLILIFPPNLHSEFSFPFLTFPLHFYFEISIIVIFPPNLFSLPSQSSFWTFYTTIYEFEFTLRIVITIFLVFCLFSVLTLLSHLQMEGEKKELLCLKKLDLKEHLLYSNLHPRSTHYSTSTRALKYPQTLLKAKLN